MAITIDTHPSENITNAPEFTVTTSLTESASQNNVRIRATVYVAGETEPVAVFEQPKGLDDWDFFELLNQFVGRCDEPVHGSNLLIGPTLSSELLSSWSNYLSGYETFTTSGKNITSIADTNTSGGAARSNDLGSGVCGDVYCLFLDEDWVATLGPVKARMIDGSGSVFGRTDYAAIEATGLKASRAYYFMLTETESTPYIELYNASGTNCSMTGSPSVKKITDHKNRPAVFFMVNFEEYYDDADGVATAGADQLSDCMLFVPARLRQGESFGTFRMDANSDKFLNRSCDATLYQYGQNMEMRALFVSPTPYIRYQENTDSVTSGSVVECAGWGMLCINDDSLNDVSASTATIRLNIQGYESGVQWSSTQLTIVTESTVYPDLKMLLFAGDLGPEMIPFRGYLTKKGRGQKTYYETRQRIRRPLKSYPVASYTLRTLYETEAVNMLLHELVSTLKSVWMIDTTYDDNYVEVGVVTDEITIADMDNLVQNEIEVEWYE